MQAITKRLLFVLFFSLRIYESFAQDYTHALDMRIPFAPALVSIQGRSTLYYELHLTSFASDTLVLQKLEVVTDRKAIVFFSVEKEALQNRYSRIGVAPKERTTILPPGGSGIIYLEFPLPTAANTPLTLTHRLSLVALQGDQAKPFSIQGGITPVTHTPPIVLGPPLSTGPWAAIYEPSWERGHRRVIYTVNGKARIPGRFAIDFIKLDTQGRFARQDDNMVNNWLGYGQPVLAVSDGTIESIRTDFSESKSISDHPNYPAEKATGNYIALNIGKNHIAFYEHLQPGSIRVKPGQQVHKGDTIASVGFTGQTTGPHLHFHVADANSPLGAEGIAFVFERFTPVGTYADFEKFGKQPWLPNQTADRTIRIQERPAPNSVIEFSRQE